MKIRFQHPMISLAFAMTVIVICAGIALLVSNSSFAQEEGQPVTFEMVMPTQRENGESISSAEMFATVYANNSVICMTETGGNTCDTTLAWGQCWIFEATATDANLHLESQRAAGINFCAPDEPVDMYNSPPKPILLRINTNGA